VKIRPLRKQLDDLTCAEQSASGGSKHQDAKDRTDEDLEEDKASSDDLSELDQERDLGGKQDERDEWHGNRQDGMRRTRIWQRWPGFGGGL